MLNIKLTASQVLLAMFVARSSMLPVKQRVLLCLSGKKGAVCDM